MTIGDLVKYSLKQLAVFDAISECGSVSLAAEKLSLTQSATSMSLAQLEKVLGRPLFERQGKKMSLTYWGMWLRPKAKRLIQDAQHIEMGFLDQKIVSGHLRIAASQTPAEHLMPKLICLLDKKYPELRIEFSVKSTHTVIEELLDYQIDFGIVEGRCDDTRLVQEIWCKDQLVIACAADHPLAGDSLVTMPQIEQYRWVLREPGSGTRAVFDSAIIPKLQHLNVWREYDYIPVIKALVKSSTYLTCLPYIEIKPEIDRGELVMLHCPELTMERPLSFVIRADMADSPLAVCVRQEAHDMLICQLLMPPHLPTEDVR